MAMGLVALSDSNIERILAQPSLVWQVVSPDDEEATEAPKQSIFAKLFGKKQKPLVPLEFGEFELRECDLDKGWHGLHFLLTGTEWNDDLPLGFIMAGEPVGDVDVGYGPPRTLKSHDVRQISKALNSITDQQLLNRFEGEAMMKADIYPQVWDREDEDLDQWMLDTFSDVKEFMQKTSEDGLGIVIYLA
jgi:hypothetical protein